MNLPGSKINLLITSIIALFILQEVLIPRYIAEPYPALKMPPFRGNTMNENGFYETINVEIIVTFGPEDTMVLTPRAFLFNAPPSFHWALLGNFKPTEKSTGKQPFKKLEFLRPVFPGFFISRGRSTYDIQQHSQTADWLRTQVKAIAPHRQPENVSFIWYREQYDPGSLSQSNREVAGTTTIQL
ncbi:hypothetical protein [Fodinibius sediminis]|uniref:Uncharacterized protein n=1 Tax=Fodinibius sediminis TaxID=1214077 RepID=A0A521B574_9BACT|nr:hypothetical protein [Fodinibius sediminis]SMO41830.1 hypothetical protein SAMN06265218_102171 [Fodinibius sediminis]